MKIVLISLVKHDDINENKSNLSGSAINVCISLQYKLRPQFWTRNGELSVPYKILKWMYFCLEIRVKLNYSDIININIYTCT